METEEPDTKQEETAETQAPPAPAPDASDEAEHISIIALKNPFFHSVAGSYFKLSQIDDKPVMIMPLEGGDVSLKMSGIKHELKLAPDDHDARTLDIIVEALDFVRGICDGDPVPSELLSGKASWEVTHENRMIAHNRVTMQLVSWMSGEETLITKPEQLAQVAEDPNTREKVNEAFIGAAEALGLGAERKEDVVSLVENLAEELSFIESLRSKFSKVEVIWDSILLLEGKYKRESTVMEVILPVKRLFKLAVDGLHYKFDEVDAQTGEILSVLKNIGNQTKFIRATRDELHRRLWAWEFLIQKWDGMVVQRSRQNEKLLEELYHFLAQRFLPVQEWELITRAKNSKDKYSTQKLW